jgi:Mg2+/Co2+ transporter CorB
VSRATGWELPEGDYETIAGLVIAEFVGLPEVGETVEITIDPDPASLLDDDEAPPRVVHVEVLEVEKHVPALVSMSLGTEVSTATASDDGRETDNG